MNSWFHNIVYAVNCNMITWKITCPSVTDTYKYFMIAHIIFKVLFWKNPVYLYVPYIYYVHSRKSLNCVKSFFTYKSIWIFLGNLSLEYLSRNYSIHFFNLLAFSSHLIYIFTFSRMIYMHIALQYCKMLR